MVNKIQIPKMSYTICDCCRQRISIYPVTLSKNLIHLLLRIYNDTKSKGFAKTRDLYGTEKASVTALLSQLQYLGLIEKYFTHEDLSKLSERSGKWIITWHGRKFLAKKEPTAYYVMVKSKRVIEEGPKIFIDDEILKWQTEDDVWKILHGYW